MSAGHCATFGQNKATVLTREGQNLRTPASYEIDRCGNGVRTAALVPVLSLNDEQKSVFITKSHVDLARDLHGLNSDPCSFVARSLTSQLEFGRRISSSMLLPRLLRNLFDCFYHKLGLLRLNKVSGLFDNNMFTAGNRCQPFLVFLDPDFSAFSRHGFIFGCS